MTWHCPWAAAQQNSCRTPSAQAAGRSELRGPCRPSHPPQNGLPLASGARTGVPPGMVARSVSPSGSMSSGHLRLPLPPRWATWPQEAEQPLYRLAQQGVGCSQDRTGPSAGASQGGTWTACGERRGLQGQGGGHGCGSITLGWLPAPPRPRSGGSPVLLMRQI